MQPAKRRVVVTGLSMISPLGSGKQANWQAVLQGSHGIRKLTGAEFSEVDCKIGGVLGTEVFDPADYPTSFNFRTSSLAAALASQAIADADLDFEDMTEREKRRTGIVIANQYGVQEGHDGGKLRLIKQMNHMIPAQIAIEHGFRGHVSGTSMASAGGAIAIGEAYRLVRDGHADRVLAGGLDYSVNYNCVSGMNAFKALTRNHNETPEEAMRPFDQARSGTVISDGGALLMLETEESARQRDAATVYGEVAGFNMNCDAYHALRPTDTGVGLISAIQEAMLEAGVIPREISAFNCHGTSTPVGDVSEAQCIKSILAADQAHKITSVEEFSRLSPEEISSFSHKLASSDYLPLITANKGNLGHCVAGAGALETAFALLSMQHSMAPKIRNLQDPLCPVLRFAKENSSEPMDVIVKNSLVFGGINSSLVLKRL